ITYADYHRLPCTTKADIAADYRQFICVDPSEIVDRSCTSGTTSTPIPFVLTEADLQRLTRNEASSLRTAGIRREDTVMLCCTVDQRFMAGLAYFLGLRQIGASVIRQGVSNLLGQWDCIRQEEPTAIICVPSFLLRMIRFAKEHGIDYRNSSLRKVVCIGESIRKPDFSGNELGRRLQEAWPELSLHSTYASTEMGAAFTECEAGHGGHHNPELTLIEILDPTGQPVPMGANGELVVTTLGVEGMPLLRFRTGDIVRLHTSPCTCGRATSRVGPVIGRKNQMLKVKGTTVYPPAIHDALNALPEVDKYVIEVFRSEAGQDDLRIRYSVLPGAGDARLQRCLREICHSRLRLKPALRRATDKEMFALQFPSGGRKPRTFIDYRT
ncbi:MAG: AMP-binding protein, partial [Bacteroidota bacterium]